MRITRQTEQELVVEDSTLWVAYFLLACSLPLFYLAMFHGKRGGLLGAAFFLLCSLLGMRKETVVFDAGGQMARWRRRRLFKVATGGIPFSEITGIGLETTSGPDSGNTYRLTILKAQGSFPLSDAYGGNLRSYNSMREAIMFFLKRKDPQISLSPDAASGAALPVDEASIRSLLEQGRKIDAVSLVRSSANVGMTEAVQRVNEINARMKAGK